MTKSGSILSWTNSFSLF